MTAFWDSWWAFAFMLAPFVIGAIGQTITIYMVYYDLDEMKAAFPKSKHIRNQLNIWSGPGFVARYMQVNAITGAVLLASFYLRRGELEPEEVDNFPKHLKPRLLWSTWLLGIGLAWLFMAVGLLKLSKG
ncbi:hypothetical protein GII23_13015 [Stutzerimonas balearica]|uniref:hypothetical protein n=1 Tax=Stutzerimonas balearica TaxID=74829 RepID=UPI0013F4A13B|nr:hypothetical protein [Stutzerimonas balearica]QIJ00926.1 hypothetical protein GII23_13015 [Stutzerimonas balearica]